MPVAFDASSFFERIANAGNHLKLFLELFMHAPFVLLCCSPIPGSNEHFYFQASDERL